MKKRAGVDYEGPRVDVSGFEPRPPQVAPPREALRAAAEAEGWPSRRGARKSPSRQPPRAPMTVRVTDRARTELGRIADDNGWSLGEALEQVIAAWGGPEAE